MKIAVLIKQVPDTETKIKINSDQSGIDESNIKYIVSPYDEFAIEQALQVKAKVPGSEVYVISLGPDRVVEAIRTALAMGADKAIHIDTANENLDSYQSAKALSGSLQELGADLIFTGKQAIDGDNAQIPQMIAEFMNIPQVMVAEGFELGADNSSAKITRRVSGGAKEVYEISFPVVVGCENGLNTPRYASLPGIMKAKTKPVDKKNASDLLGGETSKVSYANFRLPPERSEGKIIDGEPAQQVAELVRLLREEAKAI